MSVLNALIGPVAGLLDKFIPDAGEKMAIAHELSTMAERHAQELAKGQLEVNKVEAASKSLFVAGWRPFIGWVCGLGFLSNFILIPMANFGLALAKIAVVVPMIDTAQMMPVLLGMLGLGGMRTVEKLNKVSREK
jgi:hypothetical protein|tara:strand:- start:1249 stop:1653 length:405 start_codon:yes stop_codon:yes gene_type:complete